MLWLVHFACSGVDYYYDDDDDKQYFDILSVFTLYVLLTDL
jgi:hypothetical protein